MKKRLILAAAAVLALCGAGMAQARDLNWSVAIGEPGIGAVISNGPGYYGYAPRVYAPPPVVYVPAPRVVYEQPYAYAPVPWGYAPRGYVYAQPRHDHWRPRYEERTRYWRDDDRRGDWRGDHGDRGDRDGHRDRH